MSTESMIERVAKAIMAIEFIKPGAGRLYWRIYLAPEEAQQIARAALRAMQSPTSNMLDAACEAGPDTNSGGFDYDDACRVYGAMIDAATTSSDAA